jgi:hypothetical protein
LFRKGTDEGICMNWLGGDEEKDVYFARSPGPPHTTNRPKAFAAAANRPGGPAPESGLEGILAGLGIADPALTTWPTGAKFGQAGLLGTNVLPQTRFDAQ